MSQFYPQQTPSYPPEYPPENDYYYDEADYEYEDEDHFEAADNSIIRYALAFFGGGCLVFLCMSCCFLLAAGLWALDASVAATPIPGSEFGLSFDDPAYVQEPVVNDQTVQLVVLEVNRNVSLPTLPVVEGREWVVVTVELENLSNEEVPYSEKDFLLLNRVEDAYQTTSGETLVEYALGRGDLKPEQGTEGRLVFEIIAGEPELTLAWETRDSTPRFVLLQ
ncbi:MAG: DUF4352 domain-containing protein [Anaerolineae bacterium]|nr:DUF4352 domain-containing protein [Anaerolineae bacterium]